MNNTLLRSVYVVFLGLLLAVFIGIGINAFYPAPEYKADESFPVSQTPQAPPMMYSPQKEQFTIYEMQVKSYRRNVAIIALLWAILYVVLSFTLFTRFSILSDGFLVGCLATLFYAISQGFSTSDGIFHFFIVSVSVGIVLIIGYLKFINPSLIRSKKEKKKK